MDKFARILVGLFVAAAVVLGSAALLSPTANAKGRCICPKVYAPVVCDHGKTYPNQCVADCKHAKNCVPAGTL